MLLKRDISYYCKLGYTQCGIGAAILFCSFVAGVAARYDSAEIHWLLPYYVGIIMLVQGGITLYVGKVGKRWPLVIWIVLFFVLYIVMGMTLIMQRIVGAEHYAKFPCWTEYNTVKDTVRCVCGDGSSAYNRHAAQMITVNGARGIEPCVRAQNTLYIMSNCVYALTFIGLIINLITFVMACNDTMCVKCYRVGDVPQFVIPGAAGQPGTAAIGLGETIVTYRTDEQPGTSSGTTRLESAKEGEKPHAF